MPQNLKRNEELDQLIAAIEEDPSVQLDLLIRTDNGPHELDPPQRGSQVPFPVAEMQADLQRQATLPIQMRVLNRIKARIGAHEDASGASEAGRWYAKKVGDSGFITAPWCDMEACMDMEIEQPGITKFTGLYALTTAHAAYLHRKGVTSRPGTLTPGALAFQNWDLNGTGNGNLGKIDHVEFVEVDHGDGTATFIGGNVSNSVKRSRRSKAYLVVQAEWWKVPGVSSAPVTSKGSGKDWMF